MFTRTLAAFSFLLVLSPLVALAQESKAPEAPAATDAPKADASKTEPSKTEAPKSTETPKTETPKTEPAKTASPLDKKFDDLLEQWTQLRNDMEKLQIDYKSTPPAERKPLVAKFDELGHKGAKLQEQLLNVGMQAYRDSQGTNEKAGDFVQSIATRFFKQERYERALAAARSVLDTKARNVRLFSQAGIAAYHTNAYGLADKYLKRADADGVLEREGRELLASIPAVREKWETEKNIRQQEAKADDLPRVELQTTKGRVVLELFENEAPQAVANFIYLVEKGFYNGLTFHRVIGGFMAQGGDPKGDGTGGPGYHIPCECYKSDHRLHFRGSLSMAHAGKDTGGSQFFLTFVRTPHLDGQHTVFGRVLEGMDTVSQFERVEPGLDKSEKQPPADKIIEARVLRKRDHLYAPTKLPE